MKVIKVEIITENGRADIVYTLDFETEELSIVIDCLDSVYEKYDELDEVLLCVEKDALRNILSKLLSQLDYNKKSSNFTLTFDEISYLYSVFIHIVYIDVDREILDLPYQESVISNIYEKIESAASKVREITGTNN